jgi:hypothetical protein
MFRSKCYILIVVAILRSAQKYHLYVNSFIAARKQVYLSAYAKLNEDQREMKCRKEFTWERGRAIAQAVSRWLLTAAARVRGRVRSCGICGG